VLFVWDSITQLPVTETDLGAVNPGTFPANFSPAHGSTSPYVPQLIRVVQCCDAITFVTSQLTSAGLLIQRVVGQHKLFGKRVPELKVVGRFPLGKFLKGQHKTHWDLTVNGHKLKPGKYYITLRAITRKVGVRDLSRPYLLTIKKGKVTFLRVR
jgi:hypothetical protein